ncbi:hypothetical protein KFL_005560120 [Klebsormidium nitens]|uniref:Kinesin motor domain-containing protein n=1 Tax=Klebsormidium nitens TaxID=105231 RepID=A0A1Y1IGH9_KLENI|nr:hypothetical protein KFL_005560120 [Klebsormidium nitens]|eukprot:GAQ89733.1 hypothetical protein KFL_005560120 [Klebsormidium nitens]
MAIGARRKKTLRELFRKETKGGASVEMLTHLTAEESEFVDQLRADRLLEEADRMGESSGNVFVVKDRTLEREVVQLQAKVEHLESGTEVRRLREALDASEREKRDLLRRADPDLKERLVQSLARRHGGESEGLKRSHEKRLRADLNAIRSEYSRLERESADQRAVLERTIGEKERIERELENGERERTLGETERDVLREQLRAKSAEVDEKKAQYEKTHALLEEALDAGREKEDELARLRTDLRAALDRNTERQQELRDVRDEWDLSKTRVEELERLLTETKDAAAKREEDRLQLEAVLEGLKRELEVARGRGESAEGLEREVARLQQELHELQNAQEEARRTEERLRSIISTHVERRHEMEEELQRSRDAVASARKRRQRLRDELDRTQARVEELETLADESRATVSRHEEEQLDLEDRLEETERELEAARREGPVEGAETERLEREVDQLQQELQSIQDALRVAEMKETKLASTILEYSRHKKKLEGEFERLQTELTSAQIRESELGSAVAARNSTIGELGQERNDLDRRLREKEADLTAARARENEARRNLGNRDNNLANMPGLTSERSALAGRLRAKEEELANAARVGANLEPLRQEKEELQRQLAVVHVGLLAAQSRGVELQSRVAAQERTIASHSSRVSQLEAAERRSMEEMLAKEKNLTTARSNRARLEGELGMARSSSGKYQEELQSAQTELAERVKRVEDLAAIEERLRRNLEQKGVELSTRGSDADRLTSEKAELERQVLNIQGALRSAKEAEDGLRKQLNERNATMKSLGETAARQRTEYEARLASTQNALNTVTRAVHDLWKNGTRPEVEYQGRGANVTARELADLSRSVRDFSMEFRALHTRDAHTYWMRLEAFRKLLGFEDVRAGIEVCSGDELRLRVSSLLSRIGALQAKCDAVMHGLKNDDHTVGTWQQLQDVASQLDAEEINELEEEASDAVRGVMRCRSEYERKLAENVGREAAFLREFKDRTQPVIDDLRKRLEEALQRRQLNGDRQPEAPEPEFPRLKLQSALASMNALLNLLAMPNARNKRLLRLGRLLGKTDSTAQDYAEAWIRETLERNKREIENILSEGSSVGILALNLYEDLGRSCLKFRVELQGAVFVYAVVNRLSVPPTRFADLKECQWWIRPGEVRESGSTKPGEIRSDERHITLGGYKRLNTKVGEQTFGEFFSVVDSQLTNPRRSLPGDAGISTQDVFEGGAGETFESMALSTLEGRSVIAFAYGYSGSGKTTCIFGRPGDEGLLKRCMSSIKAKDPNNAVHLELAFELYGKIDLTQFYDRDKTPNPQQARSKILSRPCTESSVLTHSVPPGEFAVDRLDGFVETITKDRLARGRIKCTPNNPQSSRSHLFLVFRVRNGSTGRNGYLTFCDMAGIENPMEIAETVLVRPDTSEQYRKDKIFSYLRGTPKQQPLDDLRNEGFFINETLNHLKYFFRSKKAEESGGKYVHDRSNVYPMSCSSLRESSRAYLYDPNWTILTGDMLEETMVTTAVARTNQTEKVAALRALGSETRFGRDTIGMLSILNALNGLDGSEQPKSRFVMLALMNPLSKNGANRTFTGRMPGATTSYFSVDASGTGIGLGADTGIGNDGLNNLYAGYRAGQKTFGSGNTVLGSTANANASGPVNNSVVIGLGAADTLSGEEDVYIGLFAGQHATGVSKSVGIGARSLQFNSTGWYNSVLGTDAFANTGNSSKSVALGAFAGTNLKGTKQSILIGYQSAYGRTSASVAGDGIIAIGAQSLFNVSNIQSGIAIGSFSAYNVSTSSNLLAIGAQSAYPVTTQNDILSIGHLSGTKSTLGNDVTLLGHGSGRGLIGASCTALGNRSLANASGSNVVGVGLDALGSLDTYATARVNDGCTAVGHAAGFEASGSNCTYLGKACGTGSTGDCSIYIGAGVGQQKTLAYDFALGASSDLPPLMTGNLNTSNFPFVSVRGAMQIGQGAVAGSDAQQDGLVINRGLTSWQVYVDDESGLCVRKDGSPIAYFDTTQDLAPGMDFTATHRTAISGDLSRLIHENGMHTPQGIPLIGCVVVSTGAISSVPRRDGKVLRGSGGIGVSCALPIVTLSERACDKTVFGVFASLEDDHETHRLYRTGALDVRVPKEDGDERIVVNSGGEGAIWVTDVGGPITNGDLLCTSPIPGLAMLQADDIKRSYTVAKATMDATEGQRRITFEGREFTASLIACVYSC